MQWKSELRYSGEDHLSFISGETDLHRGKRCHAVKYAGCKNSSAHDFSLFCLFFFEFRFFFGFGWCLFILCGPYRFYDVLWA